MADANEIPIAKMDTNQLDTAYQQADRERNMLVTKLSELQQESREHLLVLDAFEKVEPTRRCFRLIGGVLVEQTVGEVKAPLSDNQKLLKEKTDRIQAIVQRTNKIGNKNSDNRRETAARPSNDRGVLV